MIKKTLKFSLLLIGVAVGWAILSCTIALISTKTDKMKQNITITAHRGGGGYGLENSLSAINRSVEAGVQSIEIDVQISADGRVFVCHDNTVDRTTNGEGEISKQTFEELRKLRLKDESGNIYDEGLPLLSEVLEAIGGKSHLLLEIKRYADTAEGLQKAVVEELHRYNAESWTTIQSFSDETLQEIHSLDPTLRLEKLAFCKIVGLPILFDGAFRWFSFEKYSYVESFNLFYGAATKCFVKKAHKAGKRVRIWTVNKPTSRYNRNVDGIITDYPDLFIEHYK
jgi:glycerophosphoryl diester phosphodiesterase